jgi:tellurite resistance protein
MMREMIKFVSENFEVIKNQFIKQEEENGGNCFLDEVYDLDNSKVEELLEIINECSLGVDFDNDKEVSELFRMIKEMKEGDSEIRDVIIFDDEEDALQLAYMIKVLDERENKIIK